MIKIICVGKIKEKYLSMAIDEYLKRLSKYSKIDIVEIPDEPVKEKALVIEGEKILNKINDKDYVITLDILGKSVSSLEFSSFLENQFVHNSNIVFVIGGSYGLADFVKKRSNYSLSFSKMTFPHQLFRVMLLEQIYRSFKIANNESYHK